MILLQLITIAAITTRPSLFVGTGDAVGAGGGVETNDEESGIIGGSEEVCELFFLDSLVDRGAGDVKGEGGDKGIIKLISGLLADGDVVIIASGTTTEGFRTSRQVFS